MSRCQVVKGGWIDWAKKDLSECLDLEELEKLFHAEDDKKGKKNNKHRSTIILLQLMAYYPLDLNVDNFLRQAR